MKKLILTICFLLACSTAWAAVENFSTGWTETDPNSHITITSATKLTYADLSMNENARLDKNSPITFSGNFDISFVHYTNSASQAGNSPWILYMIADDGGWVGDYTIHIGEDASGYVLVELGFYDMYADVGIYESNNNTLALNTAYYYRLKRVGTTITLDAYANASDMATEANVVVALSGTGTTLTLNTQSVLYVWNNSQTEDHDGYIENLDLEYVPPSGVPPVIIIEESQAEQEYKSRHCRLESQVTDKICWRCCEDSEGCYIEGCELPQEDAFLYWKPSWDESLLRGEPCTSRNFGVS